MTIGYTLEDTVWEKASRPSSLPLWDTCAQRCTMSHLHPHKRKGQLANLQGKIRGIGLYIHNACHPYLLCLHFSGLLFFELQAGGNTILDVKHTARVIHVGSVHLSLGSLLRCRWTALTAESMSRARQYYVFVRQLKQGQRITFSNKTFTYQRTNYANLHIRMHGPVYDWTEHC